MSRESLPVREPVFSSREELQIESRALRRGLLFLVVSDILMWLIAAWFFVLTDYAWVIVVGSAAWPLGWMYDDVRELWARRSREDDGESE